MNDSFLFSIGWVTSKYCSHASIGSNPALGSLFLSSFVGGLIPYLLNLNTVSDTVIGSLLSLTLGMLLYIIIFELWPKVIKSKNKKITIIGLITGVILLLLSLLI